MICSFTHLSPSLTKRQELSQVSTDPIPGTKVQLAEEGNVFLWHVEMQGPAESSYAVCNPRRHAL